MTDLDHLLPAIQSGDAEAFADFVAGAEAPLRTALRSFAARVDVEAVLQQSLLQLWKVAPRIRPDGRPNTLIRVAHRMARNAAVSELRRRGEATEPEEVERLLDGSGERVEPGTGPDPLLRRHIVQCLERLPGKPAQAMALRLESGGAEADEALAARVGMRVNTFLQNFTRARKFLADCLRKRGVDLAEVLP